jgi:hypothetical protein
MVQWQHAHAVDAQTTAAGAHATHGRHANTNTERPQLRDNARVLVLCWCNVGCNSNNALAVDAQMTAADTHTTHEHAQRASAAARLRLRLRALVLRWSAGSHMIDKQRMVQA